MTRRRRRLPSWQAALSHDADGDTNMSAVRAVDGSLTKNAYNADQPNGHRESIEKRKLRPDNISDLMKINRSCEFLDFSKLS